MSSIYINISFDTLLQTTYDILCKYKVDSDKANRIATVIANSTLDGVNSHGINRLPLLIKYIQEGHISLNAEPEIFNSNNTFCQVEGNSGFGILNAEFCTNKAIEIANDNAIGLVSLRNTNHWLRAGTYGWHAAEQGYILIAWTNTIPNLPPYGSKDNILGNNPLTIAIPSKQGHIVLDMSLSQYSYGKIAEFTRQEKDLTEYGGYDAEGNITKNASKIRNGGTHLPIGYWKGSALSIVLDLMAAILSGGKTTTEIGRKSTVDTNISQVFIAINPTKFGDSHFQQNLISETIEHFRVSSEENINEIRYPGKGVLERRKKNLADGIKVETEIWEKTLIL